MARIKYLKSGGLAALAASLAFVALPSAASADPGDGRGGGRWQGQSENRGDENRGNREGRGGREQRQQAAPQVQAQPQAQVQPRPQPQVQAQVQAPQGRSWSDERAGNRGRWNNGGSENRPAPTYRNGAPVASGQVQPERNRNYSDPNRSGTYTRDGDNRDRGADRQQGWNGQRWNGQNTTAQNNGGRSWDRNRDGRPDGNRDWNRDRSNGWDRNNGGWDRNHVNTWSRDWRRDNRYNWSGWRNSHRDIFRSGRYYSPYRDYSYNRLSIGFTLDSLFFGSNYWINDPWQYRLPPADGPYRWVRYYDDALLVNIYSGEVVDVIYDIFW